MSAKHVSPQRPPIGEGATRRAVAVLDQRLLLLALLLLAIGYTLWFARPVLLPVTVAVLLKLLLNPLVRVLSQRRIPEPVGAALVLLVFLALLAIGAAQLLAPAKAWIDALPQHMERLEQRIDELRQPVGALRQAAERVQAVASGDDGDDDGGAGDAAEPVPVEVRDEPLSNVLVVQTGSVLAGAVVVLILLYFLLAVGDVFLRKVVKVIPTFADKRRAVEVAHEVQADLSRYLVTVTLINMGLGVAVAAAMAAWGMPNPLLLGVLAGVTNFVPYLGPVVVFVFACLLALVTYPSLGMAVLPPLTLAMLNSAEGLLITPAILGRRFAINPVVIFVWLLFWGWLWGVLGALMAVPMLTGFKILCQRYAPLQPIAELLAPREATSDEGDDRGVAAVDALVAAASAPDSHAAADAAAQAVGAAPGSGQPHAARRRGTRDGGRR